MIERETVTERGVKILRDRMLSGDLRPGDRVKEEAMAQELGISRPTMREVLNSLSAEGVLVRSPKTRVLHVAEITPQEVREAFIARRLIELAAVDAASTAPAAGIRRLEEATAGVVAAAEDGNPAALTQADIECHVATVSLLGSTNLSQFYRRLLARIAIAMSQDMRSPEELEHARAAHMEFLELIRAGAWDAARSQLAARLDASEEGLLEVCARAAAT